MDFVWVLIVLQFNAGQWQPPVYVEAHRTEASCLQRQDDIDKDSRYVARCSKRPLLPL